MTYENTQYEDSIELLALVVSVLRNWKWLLAAAVLGALLFGTYKGVLRPERAGSETEIEELQEAINENTKKLSKNEEEIATNESGIAERQERIAADEELLPTQQELEETLKETLSALRTSLQQAQAAVADSNVSSNQTVSVITQMITLSDDIRDTDTQLNSAAARVSNTKKEIATWQSEIDKMIASNETLEETNAELRKKIQEQEAEIGRLTGHAGRGLIIKCAMIGAGLGALAVCGIIYLQFVLYEKLRTADELNEQYGFPILGEFWSAKAKNHNKFNRMLDRLVGDVQTLPEEQQIYKLIAAGIQTPELALPVHLMVTGTARKESLHEVGVQLKDFLPEGYKLTVAANPVYNPEPLANLKKYTVLLVEKKGISDKGEIAKLAKVLRYNDVKVIGAVVL